tara:strand:+ start:194 stop:568 length:375 start_codon:yes stop_codon:yes gene_type:complete
MENFFKVLSNYFLSKCRKIISLPEEIDNFSVPQRVWLVLSVPIFSLFLLAVPAGLIYTTVGISVGVLPIWSLLVYVFASIGAFLSSVLGPVLLYKLIDMLNNLVKFVLKKESSNLTSNTSEKEK